jgi:hypothetical protein
MLNRLFSRDTQHVWLLAGVLAVGGLGFKVAQGKLVPKTFGDTGPYRAAVIDELKAKWEPIIPSDAQCLECHQDVGEERKEALHKTVRCYHCHGLGTVHMQEAKKAKDDPNSKIAKAVQWDLNWLTTQDLYNTKHLKSCTVCHETVVGMPKDFKQIVVVDHLKENEPENPKSPEVCSECHDGHNTAP